MRYYTKREIINDGVRDHVWYRVYRDNSDHGVKDTPDYALYYPRHRAVSRAKIYQALEQQTGEIRVYDGTWWPGLNGRAC